MAQQLVMAEFELKKPKNRELLGGDLLAQALSTLGVNVAFGLHGGHLDAFLVGCHDAGIDLIDTRHETVAVQAAEGYAKVTGRVGVCFVTANSGFCNGFPGLATAFADRSPVFCITSSPPLRDAETNCLQGFHDQVILAKPVTKFAHRVTNVEEIPRLVAYAFHSAISGAPGPVLIDFPVDVLFSPPRLSAISFGAITRPSARSPAPDPAAVEELLTLWKASSRPVIITGTGARGTNELLLALAEKSQTPVFYSSKYSNAIPYGHKLRGGPAGLLTALPALGNPQPDFVILLGARTGFLLGGRSGAIIPNTHRKVIQIDVDGAEIGKSHPIDLGIVSDSTRFLEATLAQIDRGSTSPFKETDEWTKLASSLKSLPSPQANDPHTQPDGRLHPYHAVQAVMAALPRDSIITIDGGEAGVWAQGAIEAAKPHLAMSATGYLGFLGNGWGYALGCAVADPSRLVVNVHGDGSVSRPRDITVPPFVL